MTPAAVRGWWFGALVVVLVAPIAIRFATAERTGFADEAVILTGLMATSTMVAAIVLPSRLRSLTRAFGLEQVMVAHRLLGVATVVLVVLHVLVLVAESPANLALMAPGAPPRAVAGMFGVAAAVGITLTALPWARARSYEWWRAVHVLLALGLLVTAAAHIVLLRHLILLPVAGAFLGAVGGVVALVLVWRWAVAPAWGRGRFLVDAVTRESPTVCTLALRPARPDEHLRFEPGQFAWLRLARNAFSGDHPFTIASAEQDGTRPTFTIRSAGDWTGARLARLWPGDTVWVDGPHGGLTPNDATTGLVLIAGGVGITPMMSMIRTLVRRRDRRSVWLFLVERPGEELFSEELRRASRRLNLTVTRMPAVDVAARAPVTAQWLESGLPGAAARGELDYFVCAAPLMVDDTVAALAMLGVPGRRVHTELFDVS